MADGEGGAIGGAGEGGAGESECGEEEREFRFHELRFVWFLFRVVHASPGCVR